MAASLIISFLIAWLALPVIATRLLSIKDAKLNDGGRLTRAIHSVYRRLMTGLLGTPLLVVLIILPLVLVGFLAFKNVQSGFMPTMDEGGFIIDYRAPPGTSLAETDRLVRQVEAILLTLPEVQTYSRRTGLGLGGDLNEANQGDFFVRLKAGPRRGIEEIMDDLRTQVEHNVPGLAIETAQLMEDLIGDLTSVPQPIEIKIFSDDEATLQKLAPQVANAISSVPGRCRSQKRDYAGGRCAGDPGRSSQGCVGGCGRGFNYKDIDRIPERQRDYQGVAWTQARRYSAVDPAERSKDRS